LESFQDVRFGPDGRCLHFLFERELLIVDTRPVAEARILREALGLLRPLLSQPLTRADLLEKVRTERTVSAAARQRALALAGRGREDGERLAYTAWATARSTSKPTERYRQALRCLQRAFELGVRREAHSYHLGLLQYRAGLFAKAARTLAPVVERPGTAPSCLAVLAMAQSRSGDSARARATLVRLRQAVTKLGNAGKEYEKDVREAEEVVEGKKRR
jgi:hypothetical protein